MHSTTEVSHHFYPTPGVVVAAKLAKISFIVECKEVTTVAHPWLQVALQTPILVEVG